MDNQIRMHEADLAEPQDFTDYMLIGRDSEENSSVSI